MNDTLAEFKKAGWGWALWNFTGGFGICDSGRYDVAYENWHGRKLDRAMLELLAGGLITLVLERACTAVAGIRITTLNQPPWPTRRPWERASRPAAMAGRAQASGRTDRGRKRVQPTPEGRGLRRRRAGGKGIGIKGKAVAERLP